MEQKEWIVNIGIIVTVITVGLIGVNNYNSDYNSSYNSIISGLHHIPTEQVYLQQKIAYPYSVKVAELVKTCYTPNGEKLDVGHCWYNSRKDQWYWCRPNVVDRNTGERINSDDIESSFESIIRNSAVGIIGVGLISTDSEHCIRYEGKDIYQ